METELESERRRAEEEDVPQAQEEDHQEDLLADLSVQEEAAALVAPAALADRHADLLRHADLRADPLRLADLLVVLLAALLADPLLLVDPLRLADLLLRKDLFHQDLPNLQKEQAALVPPDQVLPLLMIK